MKRSGCREWEQLVVEFASGRLEEARRSEVERHIESCEACGLVVRKQREMWGALDGWDAPEPSTHFDRQLRERIAEKEPWWALLRPWVPALVRRGIPIAAVAALGLVAVLNVGRVVTVRPPSPPSAQVEPQEPEQADQMLQEMELVREFSGIVRPDAGDSQQQ